MFGSSTSSSPTARFVIAGTSSSSSNASSKRASDAPRQKWVPNPNPRCGFGERSTSKRNGSAYTSPFRLADGYNKMIRSPSATG